MSCKSGGLVIIHRKDGWKVEEWKYGKAPAHEHFSWDFHFALNKKNKDMIYPKLKDFPIGSGLLVGHRCETFKGLLPYYLLDGISLVNEAPKKKKNA